jgi:hypothetical protein
LGRPGRRIVGDTERPGLGATRGLAARHRRRMRESGRLDNPSPVKPEMQGEGKPESYIAGAAGGGGSHRGNSEPHRNRQRRRYAKFGVTRASIAGTAEGSKPRGDLRIRTPAQQKGSGVRGNPETQPELGGKMQEAGQPATSSTGRTGRCMIH